MHTVETNIKGREHKWTMTRVASLFLLIFSSSIHDTSAQAKAPDVDPALVAAIEKDLANLEASAAKRLTRPEDLEPERGERARWMDVLIKNWVHTDEKQKLRFRQVLEKLFSDKHEATRRKILETLGKMKGGEKERESVTSSKTLWKHHGELEAAKLLDLRLAAIKEVGLLAQNSSVPSLIDLLKDNETRVVVAAIEALGEFKKAATETRKEIFEKVLRTIPTEKAGGSARGVTGRPSNTPERLVNTARVNAIREAADKTLAALTGQSLTGPEAWSKWWNNEGKRLAKW